MRLMIATLIAAATLAGCGQSETWHVVSTFNQKQADAVFDRLDSAYTAERAVLEAEQQEREAHLRRNVASVAAVDALTAAINKITLLTRAHTAARSALLLQMEESRKQGRMVLEGGLKDRVTCEVVAARMQQSAAAPWLVYECVRDGLRP